MDYVYKYTRKQAIEDGVLVDITAMSREAGFTIPVAMTSTMYHEYMVPLVEGQDVEGRIWDVLMVLRTTIKETNHTGNELKFEVIIVDMATKLVEFKAVISGGDSAEPVMTLMMPEET